MQCNFSKTKYFVIHLCMQMHSLLEQCWWGNHFCLIFFAEWQTFESGKALCKVFAQPLYTTNWLPHKRVTFILISDIIILHTSQYPISIKADESNVRQKVDPVELKITALLQLRRVSKHPGAIPRFKNCILYLRSLQYPTRFYWIFDPETPLHINCTLPSESLHDTSSSGAC